MEAAEEAVAVMSSKNMSQGGFANELRSKSFELEVKSLKVEAIMT